MSIIDTKDAEKAKDVPATSTYNGWGNRETWNVNLWVMNEEGLYHELVLRTPFTTETARDFVKEVFPSGTPDMCNAGELVNVDYQELVDAWNAG